MLKQLPCLVHSKEVMSHELPENTMLILIMVGQSGLNAVERVVMGSVSSIIRQALAMS